MEKNAMQRLNDLIKKKNSRICAELILDWNIIPTSLKKEVARELGIEERSIKFYGFSEVLFKYCKEYIDAVCDIVPAIIINLDGIIEKLKMHDKIASYAQKKGLFVIRYETDFSDYISYDPRHYAEYYLSRDNPFDAVIIKSHSEIDTIMPFLKFAKKNGKGVFCLVTTLNESSKEIQNLQLIYQKVADSTLKGPNQVEIAKIPNNENDDRSIEYPLMGVAMRNLQPVQVKKIVKRTGNIFTLFSGYGIKGVEINDVAINFDEQGSGAIVRYTKGIIEAYKKDCWKDEYSEETWAKAARAEVIRATNEINQAIRRKKENDEPVDILEGLNNPNSKLVDEVVKGKS